MTFKSPARAPSAVAPSGPSIVRVSDLLLLGDGDMMNWTEEEEEEREGEGEKVTDSGSGSLQQPQIETEGDFRVLTMCTV